MGAVHFTQDFGRPPRETNSILELVHGVHLQSEATRINTATMLARKVFTDLEIRMLREGFGELEIRETGDFKGFGALPTPPLGSPFTMLRNCGAAVLHVMSVIS